MPELPEVETIARGLKNHLLTKKIASVRLNRRKLRYQISDDYEEMLTGWQITHIRRRAKYLILELQNSQLYGELCLIFHLGMTGKLLYLPNATQAGSKNAEYLQHKHSHIIFSFTDGASLIFNDARRFGYSFICGGENLPQHKFFANLGIEPLSDEFNGEFLHRITRGRIQSIKSFLLNQKFIVGVGNIYASESLFLAGISPFKPANQINITQAKTLSQSIKEILNAAITSGGSSLRDYVRSSGDVGSFQHKFAVYGRQGKKCTQCGNIIEKITQNNRSTFFCSNCQP